ncbi:MAG: transposase [Bacteroidales bacterium]|nr:transposase [Bacteroidales bacterium]MCF8404934.1 transposase [Bacteroidales bacterium]
MSLKHKFKNPDGMYFVTFAVVDWVDVFTRDVYRWTFVDSLNWSIKNKSLIVFGWVLMTNHVHLIVARKGKYKLEEIFRDIKKFTSVKIINEIQTNSIESRKDWMIRIFIDRGQSNTQNEKFQFWQHGNHPIELDNNKIIEQKLDYLHNNPVLHGFANKPEAYNWSSALDYSGMKGYVDIELLD